MKIELMVFYTETFYIYAVRKSENFFLETNILLRLVIHFLWFPPRSERKTKKKSAVACKVFPFIFILVLRGPRKGKRGKNFRWREKLILGRKKYSKLLDSSQPNNKNKEESSETFFSFFFPFIRSKNSIFIKRSWGR